MEQLKIGVKIGFLSIYIISLIFSSIAFADSEQMYDDGDRIGSIERKARAIYLAMGACCNLIIALTI